MNSFAINFQANSSDLLAEVENAITEVKRGIDNMAQAQANLDNATEIAEQVLGMTIPVDEQTINDTSQRILGIEVDEALVNATLKNATEGLAIAKRAQKLAERAKYVNIRMRSHRLLRLDGNRLAASCELHAGLMQVVSSTCSKSDVHSLDAT